MGSGCFRAGTHPEVTIVASNEGISQQQLSAQLKPIIQLAGKPSTHVDDEKVEEALTILSTISIDAASEWFAAYLAKASLKTQAGLLLVMQKLIDRALYEQVAAAEEAISTEFQDAGDIPRVAQIVALCKDHLKMDPSHRAGVSVAMRALSDSSQSSSRSSNGGFAACLVPTLDRFVLLLRNSHLAHIESSAENQQQWRELESHVGLPALDQHLPLFSIASKAVLLSLMLVPEACPPLVVVVKREEALLNAIGQLPSQRPPVLMPYFESITGTKIVQDKRVEGGEGHGPRKEFFIAATLDAIKKWDAVVAPTSPKSFSTDVQVSFVKNQIALIKCAVGDPSGKVIADARVVHAISNSLVKACVGDLLRFQFFNAADLECTITAINSSGAVSTNRDLEAACKDDSTTPSSCTLLKPFLPLFEFHRGTGQYWFSAYATELDSPVHGQELAQRYLAFGKLLVLALANRCKIAFVLPPVFFHLLWHRDEKMTMEDLKGFDSELHASLKKCLKLSASQFNSLKEVEGAPADMSREEYVAQKVRDTFTPQALQQVRAGFWCMAQPCLESGITGGESRHLLCPVEDLDANVCIRDVFKVDMEEEMANCELFAETFWSVIDGLSPDEKKLFLVFVTGSEALPEPGSERLVIELPFSAFSPEEHLAMLHLLPQAHTCTNTLELPNYYEALKESGKVTDSQGPDALSAELRSLLHTKLLIAISETSGYELDATANAEEFPTLGRPIEDPPAHAPAERLDAVPPEPSGQYPFDQAGVALLRPPASTVVAAGYPQAAQLVAASSENTNTEPIPQSQGSDVDTFLAELEMGIGHRQ